jgi:hypothetical protein
VPCRVLLDVLLLLLLLHVLLLSHLLVLLLLSHGSLHGLQLRRQLRGRWHLLWVVAVHVHPASPVLQLPLQLRHKAVVQTLLLLLSC